MHLYNLLALTLLFGAGAAFHTTMRVGYCCHSTEVRHGVSATGATDCIGQHSRKFQATREALTMPCTPEASSFPLDGIASMLFIASDIRCQHIHGLFFSDPHCRIPANYTTFSPPDCTVVCS